MSSNENTVVRLLRILFLAVPMVWSITSCKVTTPINDKPVELPADYGIKENADTVTIADKPWRVFYTDTCLTRLIDLAFKGNPDLPIAQAEIDVAQATFIAARAGLLPSINAALKGSVDRYGEYTMNGIGNDDTNRSESLPADKKLSTPYVELFGGLTFNWEANLWGKLSNKRNAALARLLSTTEMRHGLATLLVGQIADAYYTLLGLDQEKKVLQENFRLQEIGFEMMKIQKDGGKVNQVAVDQFESQLLNTRSRMVKVDQEILATEAAINRWIGRYPQPLQRMAIGNYPTLTQTFAGSPSSLIHNRPDIRARELDLVAASLDVKVARAAFYPSLQLSAAAGFSAFDLSKLVLFPGSSVYSAAAGLSAPVFQRKQIKALYTAATARQRIALSHYQKTILTGYHEVYTVFNNFYNLTSQVAIKQREAEVQRRAFNNSNDLFSVGYATYLEVILAQRRLLEVELELTELKMEQLRNHALLYRSLGGGWNKKE